MFLYSNICKKCFSLELFSGNRANGQQKLIKHAPRKIFSNLGSSGKREAQSDLGLGCRPWIGSKARGALKVRSPSAGSLRVGYGAIYWGIRLLFLIQQPFDNSGAQTESSCLAVPLLGLFSRALAQNGTMSCWNSITFPAVNWPMSCTSGM